MLLTLTPPSFALPSPWRSVTYRDLLPALRETANRLTGADAGSLSVCRQVDRLDAVATAYDPAVDLDTPFALYPKERHLLNEARLLSLVEKVRGGRFAEIATNLLTSELGDVSHVTAGFSNGYALHDWFLDGPAGRLLGWQIQGNQFRLAVIGGTGDPHLHAGLQTLVAELYESYFDFTLPDHLATRSAGIAGKKQWLGYKPSFVYRYNEAHARNHLARAPRASPSGSHVAHSSLLAVSGEALFATIHCPPSRPNFGVDADCASRVLDRRTG